MSPIDFSSLNTFDYVVLTIVGLSTLFAFFRGFVHTVLSFLAWIGSIFFAIYLFPYIQPLVAKHVNHEIVANILAFMGGYFASLIVITIINYQVLALVSRLRLGAIDKSLGFAFGLARGCVLVILIFMTINFFISTFGMRESEEDNAKPKMPEWLVEAQTYEPLRMGSASMVRILPKNLWKDAKEYTQMFNTPSSSKLWRPEMNKAVSSIVSQLPEDMRSDLLDKYGAKNWADVPVEQRKVIADDVIASYKQLSGDGKISQDALDFLERLLHEGQPTEAELRELRGLFSNPALNNGKPGKVMEDIKGE